MNTNYWHDALFGTNDDESTGDKMFKLSFRFFVFGLSFYVVVFMFRFFMFRTAHKLPKSAADAFVLK